MAYVSLQTLSDRVYANLDGNVRLYPQPVVTGYINEAIRAINFATGLFQATIQLTAQARRHWYSIQGMGLIYPSRVSMDNTYMEKTSLLQIGRGRNQWTQESSQNQLQNPVSWLPFGFTTIAIWPSDAIGGKLLYVTGCAEPPQLVNLTDTINLDNSIFAAFDCYASSVLTLKESPKTFAQASVAYQEYLRILKKTTIYRSFIAPSYFIAESNEGIKRA